MKIKELIERYEAARMDTANVLYTSKQLDEYVNARRALCEYVKTLQEHMENTNKAMKATFFDITNWSIRNPLVHTMLELGYFTAWIGLQKLEEIR